MKLVRQALFWCHLAAGLSAEIVVFIMSVTGVALTYQRQMQLWADRGDWTPPAGAADRLSAEALLAHVFLRFAHTGEVLGLTGQTIAGIVSAASLVLYAGIALSLRRLAAWVRRRTRVSVL